MALQNQWHELGQAFEAGEAGEAGGGKFGSCYNHPANMQRQIYLWGLLIFNFEFGAFALGVSQRSKVTWLSSHNLLIQQPTRRN